MLKSKEAITMIAVKDIQVAAEFYESTLGLQKESVEGGEVITYRSGSTKINIYRSQYAGSNKATTLMWDVGDEIDTIARTLKDKGVIFEHYDLPGLTLEGDIHAGGDMKVAWFRDPDGNILSIVSG
ncbi:VOC family protein [Herminiimonas contaminans]|uniref:VOC family protein n=1 Tax=Herminiimonas contaminans TaxID=1111140 RepID=A0ABS0EPX6_9BURK|nr:VOC family protein [Herminiimonas contaminans]MBF8176925.1 VOC family protein [Herminiimonas contaminans]